MLSYLRHIRRQPKSVRNQYAFALAATFTVLVGSVWLYSTLVSMSPSTITKEDKGSKPFSTLFRQIQGQWASATEATEELLSATSTDADTESVVNSRSLILSEENIRETTEKASTSLTEQVKMDNEIVVQIATTSNSNTTSTTTVAE